MNVETLNHWGAEAVNFAWPMFWQSSLLILLLLGLDWLLRRRLCAAVRYGLWLVLLLKLVLPPSFALPTSVAWWLGSPSSKSAGSVGPPIAPPVAESSKTAGPGLNSFARPTSLSFAGWILVGSGIISLALLASMLIRGRKMNRHDRLPRPGTARLDEILEAAKNQVRVRSRVRLKLTDHPISPAACGLLRPVILLPRLVADQLPPFQLRAVFLHELFHLRRGDVWVNCFQTLLQAFYWWHPLLWLANARIRRLREEAVDDAVVITLQGQADQYVSALVRVARLA